MSIIHLTTQGVLDENTDHIRTNIIATDISTNEKYKYYYSEETCNLAAKMLKNFKYTYTDVYNQNIYSDVFGDKYYISVGDFVRLEYSNNLNLYIYGYITNIYRNDEGKYGYTLIIYNVMDSNLNFRYLLTLGFDENDDAYSKIIYIPYRLIEYAIITKKAMNEKKLNIQKNVAKMIISKKLNIII